MSARSLDGGLRGQRKEKKVLHFFPPREGAAPLEAFHFDAHTQSQKMSPSSWQRSFGMFSFGLGGP